MRTFSKASSIEVNYKTLIIQSSSEYYQAGKLMTELLEFTQCEISFSAFICNCYHIVNLIEKFELDFEKMPNSWVNYYGALTSISSKLLHDKNFQIGHSNASKLTHTHKVKLPLYSMLVHPPAQKNVKDIYHFLQMLVFFQWLDLSANEDNLSESYLIDIALLLRQSNQLIPSNELKYQQAIFDACSSHIVANLCQTLATKLESDLESDPMRFSSHTQKFRSLLKLLSLFEPKNKKTNRLDVASHEVTRKQVNEDDFIQEETTIWFEPSGEPMLYDFHSQDGGHFEDLKTNRCIVQSTQGKNRHWQSVYAEVRKNRTALEHIISRNQSLLYSTDKLSSSELAILKKELNGTLESGEAQREQLEVWLVIWLILITGKRASDLIPISLKPSDYRESEPVFWFAPNAPYPLYLFFHSDFKNANSQRVAQYSPLLESKNNEMLYRVGTYFYQDIRRLMRLLSTIEGTKNTHRLIKQPAKAVEVGIKLLCKQLNRNHSCNLSLSKLSTWLTTQVKLMTGDNEDAVFWITKSSSISKPAQVHYTNVDTHYYQNLYHEITSNPENIGQQSNQSFDFKSGSGPGSQLVVKTGTVTKIAAALFKRVQMKRPLLPSELAKQHNYLVDYIYLMLSFGVGIRSVYDPVASINDIDWQSGVIQLNDKNMRAACNIRYVCLPNTILEQLKQYRRHLKNIEPLFELQSAQSENEITQILQGRSSHFGLLFYFNEKTSKLNRVRPKLVSKRFESLFPLPLNCGRHYLRTQLLVRHCPSPLIDALLGHGEIGTEASSRFSSLSFSELFELSDNYLQPLLSECNWQVVKVGGGNVG